MTAVRAVAVAATQTAANLAAAAGHEMPDEHCEAHGHRDDIDDVESVHAARSARMRRNAAPNSSRDMIRSCFTNHDNN
jgi:hypothetical protein